MAGTWATACRPHRTTPPHEPARPAASPRLGGRHARIELRFAPAEQFNQARHIQSIANREIRLVRDLRKTVPRARQLAIVATIDTVTDQRPQFHGNRSLQFYRQIRNAPPRIEAVRPDDRLRRAHRDAFRARAAMVPRRRIHRQRQVGIDLAQEKIRPRLARQQQGVLAAPAEAGLGRELDFHDRRRIGEHAVAERPHFTLDPVGQFLHPAAQYLVVVPAPRIPRDVRMLPVGKLRPAVAVLRQVVHAARDHAQRPRHEFGRPRPGRAMACHIIHLAVPPARKPLREAGFGGRKIRVGDPHALETQLASPGLDGQRKACEIALSWGRGGGHRPILA